jgi:hypothetical protein
MVCDAREYGGPWQSNFSEAEVQIIPDSFQDLELLTEWMVADFRHSHDLHSDIGGP